MGSGGCECAHMHGDVNVDMCEHVGSDSLPLVSVQTVCVLSIFTPCSKKVKSCHVQEHVCVVGWGRFAT